MMPLRYQVNRCRVPSTAMPSATDAVIIVPMSTEIPAQEIRPKTIPMGSTLGIIVINPDSGFLSR